jgi:acylphosphatase
LLLADAKRALQETHRLQGEIFRSRPSEVGAVIEGVHKLKEIRAEIDVIGLVQGVGYRFFVIHAARSLGLKGYAKNMPNGSVKVEVEGDRGIIEELLKQLRIGPRAANVKDLRVEWSAFSGDLGDFEIRF